MGGLLISESRRSNRVKIGANLKAIRLERGLTVDQVQRQAILQNVGWGGTWLHRTERGDRTVTPEDLRFFAAVYGVPSDELLRPIQIPSEQEN